MNALQLLKQDHDKVKKLLKEADETTEPGVKTREELIGKIKQELTIHEILEEEIVYPAFEKQAKMKDIVLEGYEEHHVVDTIMSELLATDFSDETWAAKLSVMKENIEHHIEEEEGEMFKKARQIFSSEELDVLGRQIEARKREVKGESEEELQQTRDEAKPEAA